MAKNESDESADSPVNFNRVYEKNFKPGTIVARRLKSGKEVFQIGTVEGFATDKNGNLNPSKPVTHLKMVGVLSVGKSKGAYPN